MIARGGLDDSSVLYDGVGLYMLNPVEPELERRLVSTL
jgi:hypothetical protein